MNSKKLLAQFEGKTFIGLSDFYSTGRKIVSLKIRLEPSKLTIEIRSLIGSFMFTREAEYDEKYNILSLREKIDEELHKEYSQKEIKEDNLNMIKEYCLFRDPRYVLQHGRNFFQKKENSFEITAFKAKTAYFGKTSMKVEIIFEKNRIRVIRKKFVHGNKELKDQRETINFVEV